MPRPPHTEPKVRLNLELTEKVRNRLEKVRILSEADSITEVIRRALSIYDMLLNATQEHSKVILKDTNGVEREILLIEAAVIRLPPKWTKQPDPTYEELFPCPYDDKLCPVCKLELKPYPSGWACTNGHGF